MTEQFNLTEQLSTALDRVITTLAKTARVNADALGDCVRSLKRLAASDARSPTVPKPVISKLLGAVVLLQNEAAGCPIESARAQLDSAAFQLIDATIAWLDGHAE